MILLHGCEVQVFCIGGGAGLCDDFRKYFLVTKITVMVGYICFQYACVTEKIF